MMALALLSATLAGIMASSAEDAIAADEPPSPSSNARLAQPEQRDGPTELPAIPSRARRRRARLRIRQRASVCRR
jgi:hypothetical protein